MSAEQITTIITNLLTGGGVAVFLYIVIRGLKDQIGALKTQIVTLNETIEVQKKTLQAMETRVLETEKIGNIYRQFLEEFPKELENYRALHTKMKDDQIKLLQQANEQKDEKLKETAEIELEKLKLQQRALDDIPKLRKELIEVVDTLQQRFSVINLFSSIDSPNIQNTTRSSYVSYFNITFFQYTIRQNTLTSFYFPTTRTTRTIRTIRTIKTAETAETAEKAKTPDRKPIRN